jgi:hypothetical protein
MAATIFSCNTTGHAQVIWEAYLHYNKSLQQECLFLKSKILQINDPKYDLMANFDFGLFPVDIFFPT